VVLVELRTSLISNSMEPVVVLTMLDPEEDKNSGLISITSTDPVVVFVNDPSL